MEFEDEKPKPKSPRLNRKNLPKKARNMSKEQLMQAMRKKKICDAKALEIVEKALDENNPDDFIGMLKDINQCHYQDIIEERAIEKMCGYPLCKEKLPDDIPKKQYHISIATNKVYDLTERKNFCSNKCFKSSNYLKEQMLTSPLWLRDQEDIPEFKLLSI